MKNKKQYFKSGAVVIFTLFLILTGVFAQNGNTNSPANSQTENQNTSTVANAANSRPANTNTAANTVANSIPAPVVSPSDSPKTSPASSTDPKIKDIYRLGYQKASAEDRGWAGIGDIIVVEVENLKPLVNKAKCEDSNGTPLTSDCTKQELALFLDGRKIVGIVPESIALDGNNGSLQFHLKRSVNQNDEMWADLLGNPSLKGENTIFERDTKVSIGLENNSAINDSKQFRLLRIRQYRFWIFTVLYGLLLFLMYRLAVKSDILRDIGEQPDPQSNSYGFGIRRAFSFGEKLRLKPYSLARFQMAFWFLLVIGSFSYVWLITGAYDIITTEILGLIGIGAGTALGAAAIDVGRVEGDNIKSKENEAKKAELETALQNLETQLNVSPPPDNSADLTAQIAAKKKEIADLDAEIAKLSAAKRPESEGFLKDVLTDATGVSFHRFQMFIWTLVLGVIFIAAVWSRLSMPEFGATLLALFGISAGTYLGFKIPEKQS